MRALCHALEQQGVRVEYNRISATTPACLLNSFNFDVERLRAFQRQGCRLVHRVDGPIGTYRGFDDGSDRRIWQVNQELAAATIFQSHYSLQQHQELGYAMRSPVVIPNAANPQIFHAQGRQPFDRDRKIRLISSSWSSNPNKGAATYRWLEEHLDWQRFEYTFVGRSPLPFQRLRKVPPLPSEELAQLLRQHDIYITASQHDPCSNGLIEALTCGLPALYLQSGGHPEIVGAAGLGFHQPAAIPDLLEQLVGEYEQRQAQIALPSLTTVSRRYLAVLGLEIPVQGESHD
ncbi:hypothetical protein DO97_03990 [Neosynechococcus sphagnicola sy1]|uniref:Glycosyl transferase family 1 domain-containing protein n=1 Tax=Neosynechococcus sphagnicola sy1 TaxID=1497020 RepID=A0A098TKR4_9CYAN|nr:glycosyltransferase [Neosynechococcus sphagnicola]KGF72879.1 hypothetical protein DO97_03990 [Neosynechococcus sphagnicola sy1]